MQEWSALAHLYAQNSRWPECEKACLEVLERQSDNLEITELMSTACLQNEHLDAAEHLLQTLLRRVPLDPWYRMRYATLLQTQGKLGAAQQELLRLQQTKLPEAFAIEIENSIEYLDQMQFQQVMVLLEHNLELRNALARNPREELQILGFQLTESTIEMLQNVLWEHFNQAPFHAPEISEQAPRIH
jgi:hypothetical protein